MFNCFLNHFISIIFRKLDIFVVEGFLNSRPVCFFAQLLDFVEPTTTCSEVLRISVNLHLVNSHLRPFPVFLMILVPQKHSLKLKSAMLQKSFQLKRWLNLYTSYSFDEMAHIGVRGLKGGRICVTSSFFIYEMVSHRGSWAEMARHISWGPKQNHQHIMQNKNNSSSTQVRI